MRDIRGSRNPQRRRASGKRERKTSVLLLVEGEVTEKEYFEKLKYLKNWSSKISLTVLTLRSPPSHMAKEGERYLQEDSYDHVVLVFDKDDLSDIQIFQAVARSKQKKNLGKLHVCISAPKFEIWLCAHFQMMKQACDSQKVTATEIKLNILQAQRSAKQKHRRKHMPSNFPYEKYEEAKTNSNVSEFGTWDEQGSTSIPKVIEFLDALNN